MALLELMTPKHYQILRLSLMNSTDNETDLGVRHLFSESVRLCYFKIVGKQNDCGQITLLLYGSSMYDPRIH